MANQLSNITPIGGNSLPGQKNWSPNIGEEAQRLVQSKLPAEARQRVLDSAVEILSKGTPPDAPGGATGLVVGYVQSGKTLSFTTAIALARDNGFKLIIVVAGTSVPLLNQSTNRLLEDLGVDDSDGFLRWKNYRNPTNTDNLRRQIQQALDDWSDPLVPQSEKATVLITVMKQWRHLENLVDLLRQLDLDGVPTLLIDDEADQASLNTLVSRGRQSTTYRYLLDLRDEIPSHTFLQYTATPQAPLLINIIDSLSPEFAEVLDPGEAYVGGKEFFTGGNKLVQVIPQAAIPTPQNRIVDPPKPLLDALRVFLVGVAAGLRVGRSATNRNRSMLVHPSQTTDFHQDYVGWIRDAFSEWQRVIVLPPEDSDRADLLQMFKTAHADLSRTVADLPSFEELVPHLRRAFAFTTIEEVNARAGATPHIDWRRSYGWILIGGQAMDRGFTVEGLTVTYMPRGPGVGNADTVQQRGRFFGYKRSYLGYCRVYLEQAAMTAFAEYVEHEEFMRKQLKEIAGSGKPLKEWKRVFLLSNALQPCRRNVVEYGYARGNYSDEWYRPSIALLPDTIVEENQKVVSSFISKIPLQAISGNQKREPAQRHLVADNVRLEQAIEDLLVPYRVMGAGDTQDSLGALLQLKKALEDHSDETCAVYHMSPGYSRTRAIDNDGRIVAFFQGPTRVSDGSYTYPGDTAFKDERRVTIQIYEIELQRDKTTVASKVPIIAVWIPKRFAAPWVSQSQS